MQNERESYQHAATMFVGTVGLSLLVLFTIAAVAQPQFAAPLRFLLVLGFFTALLFLTWAFTTPMRDFLNARFALRYFDSGPAIERTWKLFVHSVCEIAAPLAWVAMAWVTVTLLRVLALWPWFAALVGLSGALKALAWLCVVAEIVLIVVARPRIATAWLTYQQLRTQQALSGYTPSAGPPASQEPVSIDGALAFTAGAFAWRWDDFGKNAIVFGQPGSGKTVCVLNALLDGLIGATAHAIGAQPAAGLILDPKGDFHRKLEQLMTRHGRPSDLCVIDPDDLERSVRWNPLDNSENSLELANGFVAVLRVLGLKNEQDSFWIDSARTFIRHNIVLLRRCAAPGYPPSLAELHALATNPEQTKGLSLVAAVFELQTVLGNGDRGWSGVRDLLNDLDVLHQSVMSLPANRLETLEIREFICAFLERDPQSRHAWLTAAWQHIDRAIALHGRAAIPTPPVSEPIDDALRYITHTWLPMPSDTRGSVQAYLSNMLDSFLVQPYRELFNGASTLAISAVVDQGKVMYVHLPLAKAETMAKVVSTFVKIEFYREVLKRLNKARPSFFLCDEFQSFFTTGDGKGDADFFERSRQSNHANVIATQNLEALYKVSAEEPPVKNLLANCAVKCFLRNTDERTNEYASKLFGEALESHVSQSKNIGGGIFRNGDRSSGISENSQYGYVERPESFSRLAQPDAPAGVDYAETIVHLGSRAAVTRLRLRWRVHPLQAT